jgi:two-component system response regulator AtoC
MPERILVVDDKESIRTFIADALDADGHDVTTAPDGVDAALLLQKTSFHLMITDLKMPRMDGLALLSKAREMAPEMTVIVLTAHGTVETAVNAMKLGAFDYLTKPLASPDELRMVVARALEHRRLSIRASLPEVASAIVAEDPVMRKVLGLIQKVAVTDATVLLQGESGVGKEVAAMEIHRQSPRRSAPFVAVNCAAISETLVESEMFGHEKGAFTGAAEKRIGRFEQADGGTLFLDEAGELPLPLQAKLLRVLQERRFERVGGTQTIEVDVRIVAATNRRLEDDIEVGRFREDLYHRLSVFPVDIPPLRERPGDIEPLAKHLLEEIARRIKKPSIALSAAARAALKAHPWPGNVRELGNTLERAAIIADSDIIEESHLLLTARAERREDEPVGTSLRDLERDAIKKALAATDGHRKKAAERLGIGLRTLYSKIKEYGLE